MASDSSAQLITCKETYYDLLRIWVNHVNYYQKSAHLYAANHQNVWLQTQPPAPINPMPNNQLPNRPENGTATTPPAGRSGYEYTMAPVWKRVIAECIDMVILFFIKLFLSFTFVGIFDIDLGNVLDLNTLRVSIHEDYTQLFNLASELIMLELLINVVVCTYETMWTAEGQGGGATPGKLVMGIRILYVENVFLVDPINLQQPQAINQRVKALLWPARNPGWRRAFCRAFIKNMTVFLPFFYPLHFATFMFRNYRTGYDILTKTVVVEENQVPIMRRL